MTTVRQGVAGLLDLIAVTAGKLADRLDPPGRVIDRARSPFLSEGMRAAVRVDLHERAERLLSRARHPAYAERPQTLLGEVAADDAPLAEVVPLREVVSAEELDADGWVPCSLGTITATRPIGARVRLDPWEWHPTVDRRIEGRLDALTPDPDRLVAYGLTLTEDDGTTHALTLTLSHPLEVNRDRA